MTARVLNRKKKKQKQIQYAGTSSQVNTTVQQKEDDGFFKKGRDLKRQTPVNKSIICG